MPELERPQKRQTAYKIRIKDILSSNYIKTGGFEPNYLEFNGHEISRVNVIGVVLEKSELDNYYAIILEDGTGKISARVFEKKALLDKIGIGNIVLVIGRIREFSSEKYLLIETIKKIEHAWSRVRKMELTHPSDTSDHILNENVPAEEGIIDLSPKNRIFKLIKDLDKGDGVSIEDVLSAGIAGADKIIDGLLKGGDIFEIKPGKIKVLE